jgi:hypothetical protein
MDSLLKRFHSARGSKAKAGNGVKDTRPSKANGTPATTAAPQLHGTKESPPAAASSATAAPPEPERLSTLDQTRKNVFQSMEQLRTLLKAIKAPLPTQTGDGSALPQPKKDTFSKDVREILLDIPRQDIKDIEGLIKAFKVTAMRENMDDKEYLMESMIAIATKLPESFLQDRITETLITTLWNDLEHPPNVILGEEYEYRQPDGSMNNYKFPNVGKAGMPYARTVTPKSKNGGVLPDPGVLFDSVMARKHESGEKHPNGISSILFYLASIIIHDIFRTNHFDARISDTSSYLDLSPLYGSNWKEQKTMRTFRNGKIKPDCFAETRLLSFPPGCGALLILFNRYHNYVVEQLALINEDGRFTEDPQRITVDRYGEKGLNKRDDDLFQTARLVTCGLYINIILVDYVRTILNLNRTDDNWQLDPRVAIPGGPPVGTGNQVSAE